MGAKDSKRSCLSYEEAVKRISEAELKRVCEAFKRLTNGGQLLSNHSFTVNVLGDGVPPTIAEWLYTACGGGPRGIALRDLLCGLVLLTKGTEEEKIKFLWTLYSNDSNGQITRNEFQNALQIEGNSYLGCMSLFAVGQERVNFEEFRAWISYNKEATILSKWLLSNPRVSLSSEVETPTFYQSLAGVTHLEEFDICELEKCFWALQAASDRGLLDFNCLKSLVCPPVPLKAYKGLFMALDVNRDEHVDFKELCCGISAACRGPMAERMKFCFKIFDMDRDCHLNADEVGQMIQTLIFLANEHKSEPVNELVYSKRLSSLKNKLDESGGLTQEDFLVWSVEDDSLVAPLLEVLVQVCHVSLGLKPACRHNEFEIVTGWLEREERRGLYIGQFWYLISMEWWSNWLNYTNMPRMGSDSCNCRIEARMGVEEGIVCDESFLSNGTEAEYNSNSLESMGDLLSRGDSCSIASSSGVSSSSGTYNKKAGLPGPIDNSSLVVPPFNVHTLTGEGGRLKRDTTLVRHRDFILVPDSLWKALSMWYGGPLPLPRQVIRQPGLQEVELELYPINLKILRHQSVGGGASSSNWTSVVGGYGAAALNTAGLAGPVTANAAPRRCLAHTAAFSRLSTVQQVTDFLCQRLALRSEDARLWHLKENSSSLLDDDNATLQDLNIQDADQILLEVRNKDLTWPEEMGALVASGGVDGNLSVERRPTICLPPGATGLHNLGNTCFMNAALQAVSNTRPLTMYFQGDSQLTELNTSNPLGTKGAVARRYAELCRELWAGSTRSVAPLKLRYCVTKHAPQLGGGGQHDSQELLAWLLDALHEDLNRVAKKQYTELKDSGGRPDDDVAEEAWRHHLARDHSIITDLFYGQLKSKVTCQTCGHESVRFDAFNLLSLPLPMESYVLCEVLVVRLDGKCPIKYGLRLNSEAKYSELKEQLQSLCEIEQKRLLLAEVAYCQIQNILSDDVRINSATAKELYAYELPSSEDFSSLAAPSSVCSEDSELEMGLSDSPLARSPETKPRLHNQNGRVPLKKKSISVHSNASQDLSQKTPTFLIGIHRKWTRQETYFLSQQKSKPSLFGLPLLLGCSAQSTCKSLYESVWSQVTRLLSPLPQSDQTNHALDCDDSLGYEFPFSLKAVLKGGQICALCHWTEFCRGCPLPCNEELLFERCHGNQGVICVAIDWDHTALHLRYQSDREKLWLEHDSVAVCRKLHTEPIDLDYCLRAFTSEERLEAKYHCSGCQDKQPATKKLQIWRLPPILIVHLKRFDCINTKWVKTQKVVNFPFKDFDPTAYLASVPQETILRHRQMLAGDEEAVLVEAEPSKVGGRSRLESTSLLKTPIIDEHLKDYHDHKLLPGQDQFDLKYQLYAVVSHSGMLNGGHYISYACNPNGNWYCYNDSSCREVLTEGGVAVGRDKKPSGCTPLGRRKLANQSNRKLSSASNNESSGDSLFDSASPRGSVDTVSSMTSEPDVPSSSDTSVLGGDERKLMRDASPYASRKSLNNFRCPYNDVKTPKIDTSAAYILFYERSGLDYKPYLPKVATSGGGSQHHLIPDVELDENESELRKQLCTVQ